MNQSTFSQYQQSLHDAFFTDPDQELFDFLRSEREEQRDEQRSRLASIAGVHDPKVLETLQRAGITPASMAAFCLLPLVRLAWADESIQDNEDDFILRVATEDGIQYGTPSYRLLSKWLEERPSEKMINAWSSYAQALARELDEASYQSVVAATLGRAQRVAEASGGFLGLGAKVSENEQLVLHDLAHALNRTGS
ncbi:MAG: hypothetical protein ACK56W_21010 [Pirellula sp.]|jgi:hypothetical protein|nr:hypothetical protein [Pirellula sp.]